MQTENESLYAELIHTSPTDVGPVLADLTASVARVAFAEWTDADIAAALLQLDVSKAREVLQ